VLRYARFAVYVISTVDSLITHTYRDSSKGMSSEGVWVIPGMGYEGVDCNEHPCQAMQLDHFETQ
jgi:hypothetical protein